MQKYIIYNPHGGSEGHSQQYSTLLCLGLIKNGLKLHLVTSRDYNATTVLAMGGSVVYISIDKFQSYILRYNKWMSKVIYGLVILKNNLIGFKALKSALQRIRPEVCLLIGGETVSNILFILLNKNINSVRYGLTIHNSDYDLSLYKKDKVKLLYKLISKILLKELARHNVILFVHGKSMKKALIRYLKIPSKKISIYHVPIGLAKTAKNKRLGPKEGPIKLLFCGLVRADKGLDDLCAALSKCRPYSNWILRIAGSSRQVGPNYINEQLIENKINNQASLKLKYLTEKEIGQEFQKADIVVLPYKKGFIAQSVVMTDAVKWRKPVITTAHSQNGDSTRKYKLGWTFKSEDRQDLAKVLCKAIVCLKKRRGHFNFDLFLKDHEPGFVGNQIIRAFLAE